MIGKQNGGPAFPCKVPSHPAECGSSRMVQVEMPGMTLRDWFAGMALQGLLANGQGPVNTGIVDPEHSPVAEKAYEVADAMLKMRAAWPRTTPSSISLVAR